MALRGYDLLLRRNVQAYMEVISRIECVPVPSGKVRRGRQVRCIGHLIEAEPGCLSLFPRRAKMEIAEKIEMFVPEIGVKRDEQLS